MCQALSFVIKLDLYCPIIIMINHFVNQNIIHLWMAILDGEFWLGSYSLPLFIKKGDQCTNCLLSVKL
jgi:hypothetical protein